MARDPWGDTSNFEQIQQTARPVVKAVTKAAAAVAGDIKQQVGGEGVRDEASTKSKPAQTKGDAAKGGASNAVGDDKQKALMQQTRQNLVRINEEIKKAREAREKKYQERMQTAKREKQEKQAESQEKKKDESVLARLMRGKQGSREAHQRTGG